MHKLPQPLYQRCDTRGSAGPVVRLIKRVGTKLERVLDNIAPEPPPRKIKPRQGPHKAAVERLIIRSQTS